MKFFSAVLLVAAGLYSYFVLALHFGVYQRYPLLHIALALLGVAIMLWETRRRFSWFRAGTTTLAAGIVAMYIWWVQSYSTYRNPALRTVTALPQFEHAFALKTSAGEPFDFNAALKQSRLTLLVFNRGMW